MNVQRSLVFSSCLSLALLSAACGGRQAPAGDAAESPRAAVAAEGMPLGPEATAPALRLEGDARPLGYELWLDLDPASEIFTGEVVIALALDQPSERVWLNATELEILAAELALADETLALSMLRAPSEDFVGFDFGRTVEAGEASLRIRYRGRLRDRAQSGVFRREDEGARYLFTQFEPVSARRAFPCFDEPGFKVPWTLRIDVPEGDHALTNAPLVSEQAGPRPGTRSFQFATTEPLPSYLIAFAVGPFEFVDLGTIGRAQTPARIVVPRGRSAQVRYAAEVTPRVLDLLEAYFDQPYPYAKLDSVAVPQLGFAMEHPGLITYDDKRILAPPSQESDDFRRRYVSVALHEIAHQWFGNLVTMRWWDDLWLNESFATWMATKQLPAFEPAWHSGLPALERAHLALAADELLAARRVREPVTSTNDIFSSFNAMTYSKGNAILTMFEGWIGPERFRAGVRAYLREHAHGNAALEDFLAALAAASDERASAAVRSFLDQSGAPVISAEVVCEPGEPLVIELAQEHFLPMGSEGSTTDRVWQVPVCVKYGQRTGKPREQCVLLDDEVGTIEIQGPRRCPAWVLGNADAKGYYRTSYGLGAISLLLGPVRGQLSEAERAGVAEDLRAQIAAGGIEMGEALALVPRLFADPSERVARSALELVAGAHLHMVPAALGDAYGRFVRASFAKRARQLGWQTRPDDPVARRELRALLLPLVALAGGDAELRAEAQELARAWLAQLDALDGEQVESLGPVLAVAVATGGDELRAELVRALAGAKDAGMRRRLIFGLAHARAPEQVRANLALVRAGEIGGHEADDLVLVPLRNPALRADAYALIEEQREALLEALPRGDRRLLIHAAAAFCDQEHLDQLAAMAEGADAILGGPQAVAEDRERVKLCMVQRAAHRPSVEAFLKQQ